MSLLDDLYATVGPEIERLLAKREAATVERIKAKLTVRYSGGGEEHPESPRFPYEAAMSMKDYESLDVADPNFLERERLEAKREEAAKWIRLNRVKELDRQLAALSKPEAR